MKFLITETIQKFNRADVRGKWVLVDTKTKHVDDEYWRRSEEAAPAFRRAGGIETLQREYTMLGYRAGRILSTSPDRLTRIVRNYSVEKVGHDA